MSKAADQEYLLTEQYRDGSNLNARAYLHQQFSVNPYGWNRWLFDQFDLPPESRILEVGCGPGGLWNRNSDRIPEGWRVTLSDFSGGMLKEAARNLSAIQWDFRLAILDAQCIPFADATFDAVVANHMLYHVPDREKAFAEVHRVLRPDGTFYASTIGQGHMQGIWDLVRKFDDDIHIDRPDAAERFGLETGFDQLTPWFSDVALRRHEDALDVTEAEPLIAYILSGLNEAKSVLTGETLASFIRFVEQEIAERGAIHIAKSQGIFIARRDHGS